MAGSVSVVLADDHQLVRAGIRTLLRNIMGVEVLAEASNGEELISLVDAVHPDLVITDISMPGMDGITAIQRIHARYPRLRILVLSMHDSAAITRRAIENGACGILRKNTDQSELQLALASVMSTGSYMSAHAIGHLMEPAPASAQDELTERQVQILSRLATGETSKEIGFELGLSSKTVDVHRSRIMERLGVHDIASLTRYALRRGLVKP